MAAIPIFIYLQLLDFLTTLVGFKLGASEASPFIVKLMHATSPVVGVAASKLVGLALGGLCILLNRARLVGWINYWYAGVIIWNLFVILTAGNRLVAAH
jgi:hypothetical protein